MTILITIAAFSSLGIISAGFIIFFKKGDPLNWGFSVASWLLGGVYYPVSVLPEWMQKITWVIPMTHSLEALRKSLISGQNLSAVGPHLLILSLWALIVLPVSLACFSYALKRTRLNGNLGHY